MYAFQSKSTLYSCLNVKELLAWSRRKIWSWSNCNWTPVWPNGWVFIYKLSGSGFESSCSYLIPRLAKIYSNSIRCNCQKICSWSRKPKTMLEIRKNCHISLDDQESYYLQVFQTSLLTRERRLTRWQFLALGCFPATLTARTTDETFQQSGKQSSFRYTLKSLASIFESSCSQFFRTTIRIQFEPDAFDEWRFVMSYQIIMLFQISSRRENT